MSPKKKTTKPEWNDSLHLGGSYVGGNLTVKGGKFVGRDDNSKQQTTTIQMGFDLIYQAILNRPDTEETTKAELKEFVQELEKELKSENTKPNESFITRLLKDVKKMAPDILDVILATLQSPIKGLSEVARKIAKKAAEQVKTTG